MIEMRLAHVDLARVRFAHSPVRELVASLLVLQDPGRQCMHGGWLSAARRRLGGLELELLTALAPIGHYLPSFLFPPPSGPWGVLAEELDAVAASPPAVVRAQLDKVCQGRPLPGVLRPLYEDPVRHLPAVAEAMRRYWQATVEPVWPQLRAASAADVAYRVERFADGGLARVLADLHPEVALDADRLRVDKPHHCSHRFDLAGMGILLLPLRVHLADGDGGMLRDRPAHPDLPDAGVAELWQEGSAEQTDPLSALVGRTRATLLAGLGLPRTTTQLAGQLGLSPPAASQHLKVLKDTGLVSGRRRGRMVLYQQTAAATTLLEATRSSERAG